VTAPRLPAGRFAVWKYNWLAHHKMMAAMRRVRAHARGVLVDIGCGRRAWEPMFAARVERYWGVDLPTGPYVGGVRPHLYARAEALALRDGCAETALLLSVMNYVPDPGRVLAEARRVLKPGGTLICEFTQMRPHDPALADYFRFTREGAALLLARAGFEPREWIPVGGLASRVGLSAIGALNRVNRGPWRVLTELPVRLLYIVIQLGFEGLDRIFFDPREVLGHVVAARRDGHPAGADPAAPGAPGSGARGPSS